MADEDLLEAWECLHDMQKQVFGWPDWRTVGVRSSQSDVPLNSRIAERHELLITLADEAFNTLENLQVRIAIAKGRAEVDVTATLEAEHHNWTCISRMDFWPSSPHSNQYWRKLSQPARIEGSHHHRFHDNRRLGMKAFKPLGNLPSAISFDDEVSSFRDIVRLIQQEWRIDGIADISAPENQGRLI